MTGFGYKERIAYARGYRVAELTVLSPSGKTLHPWTGNTGYPWITIGKTEKCSVHRLVAFQLWGEMIYERGIEVRHLDGNKLNFLPANLALGTHSQNQLDIPQPIRVRIATIAAAAVKKHDHTAVRAFYQQTGSYTKTMDQFGLSSKGTLHFILNGRPKLGDLKHTHTPD